MKEIIVEENWPRETLVRIFQLNGKTPEAAGIIVNFIKEKWRLSAELVYISCPVGEPSYMAGIERLAARAYVHEAETSYGVRSVVPYAYLTEQLNEHIPSEKKLADQIDRQLFLLCSRFFVCGKRISPRMENQIQRAAVSGMPIIVFNKTLIPDVIRTAKESGTKNLSVYAGREGVMSMDSIRLGQLELKRGAGEVIG